MSNTPPIRPVIMSGGAGTRMWPVSRKAKPKQFHRLTSANSLFQETALRVAGEGFAAPIVLGSADHAALVEAELMAIGVSAETLILEPLVKNTAPAIAALCVARERAAPGEIMLVLPADHAIADSEAFRQTVLKAAPLAEAGRIVTFGIAPASPETGYGYIRAGAAIAGGGFEVAAFKEKPDLETAQTYLASGEYSWNAGIFMFRADLMLEEIGAYHPEMLDAVRGAVEKGARQGAQLLLDEVSFQYAEEISIDYAVMEKTKRAAVVKTDISWSDIGSWGALWAFSDRDSDGNSDRADGAPLLDCKNVLAVGEGVQVAAIGVSDLVIIATKDAVLVAHKDETQRVKSIVEALKKDPQS